MKFIPETLGDFVALVVKTKYRTQRAACQAWGVSRPFVSMVINGRRRPSRAMLDEVAEFRRAG